MTDSAHPRLCARGTRDLPGAVRVIVYAPAPARAAWIDLELKRADAVVQIGRSVAHVVAALIAAPAPRPQVLVVDFDAIGPGELLELHQIRDRWFGAIIGIGVVPTSLRTSLGIDRVVNTPLSNHALRDVIDDLGFTATTKQIPVLVAEPGFPRVVFNARPKASRSILRRRQG